MHKGLNLCDDRDYMCQEEGGRGLASFKDSVGHQ